MAKRKQMIFVTAMKVGNSSEAVVYYVNCPCMIDAAIAVSQMLNFSLRPTRLHVDDFEELRECCMDLYKRRELEFVEFSLGEATDKMLNCGT